MFYTKYRPQKFEDLIGQDHVARTLSAAVRQGKIVHGYLFCGSRGTGKTTVARILARSVSCLEKDGLKPCNKCLNCITIENGKSVDIIEIDAASNRGIDEIRDLREKVRFAPSQGKYKVYIIDEVHMLTKEAFNALLKTLEEPPAHAIFILATTEAHKVPATVVSRCQRFDFRRADLQSVIKLLQKVQDKEKIAIEPAALALIARAADGAYRDALTLLEQMTSVKGKITVEVVRVQLGLVAEPLMWQLLKQAFLSDKSAMLKTYKKFIEQGTDWKYLISSLIQKLGILLFFSVAPDIVKTDLTKEESLHLERISQNTGEADIVKLINLVLRAESELRFTSVMEVPLGAALVEFANSNLKIVPNSVSREQLRQSGVQKDAPMPRAPERASADKQISESQWREVADLVKEKNTALASILKQSKPYIEYNELIVEVPYKFWEDRVKSLKSVTIIRRALNKVVNYDIDSINAKSNGAMKEAIANSHREDDQELVENVKDVFGD